MQIEFVLEDFRCHVRVSITRGLEFAFANATLSVDPRWEPGTGEPSAGFCPGGGSKGPSLPERVRPPGRIVTRSVIHVEVASRRSMRQRRRNKVALPARIGAGPAPDFGIDDGWWLAK